MPCWNGITWFKILKSVQTLRKRWSDLLKNQCAWCRVSETVRGGEVWELAGPSGEVLLVSHWTTCTFILSKGISLEAQSTITDYRQLGGLYNRNLFSRSSAGWKSEIRVPVWLSFGESCLPDLQIGTLLCPTWHGVRGVRERKRARKRRGGGEGGRENSGIAS